RRICVAIGDVRWHATCPLRRVMSVSRAYAVPVTNILVATDLDERGDAALAIAKQRGAGAHITVCHVTKSTGDLNAAGAETLRSVSERVRHQLGSDARGIDVLVRTGNTADQIAACAELIGAELVVIGSTDHSGGLLRRMFTSTTVDKVV